MPANTTSSTNASTTSQQPQPQQQQQQRTCSCCNKQGKNLLACARCKKSWYCSKKCQVDHFPNHKVKCRQLAAAAASTQAVASGGGTTAKGCVKVVQAQHKTPAMPIIATVDTEGQRTIADGIKVIDTNDLGKACVSTQSFKVGDTVLLEPPAIVFDERDGYAGLFNAYLRASPPTQQKIANMYRLPNSLSGAEEDEKRKKVRLKRKQLLVHQYDQYIKADPTKKDVLPLSLAEQLIGVVDANAHAFQANHTVDIVVATDSSTKTTNNNNNNNNNNTAASVPRTYHALFTLGSRVEHSCSPNLTFITKGGKLEYMAEMDIKPNERLSISYMGGVYEKPRKQRRGFLKENKLFLCKCTRCLGYDECSPLKCDGGGGGSSDDDGRRCDGILFHHGKRNQWECQSCDKKIPVPSSSTSDNNNNKHPPSSSQQQDSSSTSNHSDYNHIHQQLRKEAELFAKIRKFHHILQTQPYPEMLQEILVVVKSPMWKQYIHPLHWLNVEAYKLISSISASAARYYAQESGEEGRGGGSNKNKNNKNNKKKNKQQQRIHTLLRLSAMSQLRRILWQERIAAIDRGFLSSKEATQAIDVQNESFDAFSHESVRVEDVSKVLEALCCCSPPSPQQPLLQDTGTLGVSPAFHAGQDLILAGQKDLALKLYQRFEVSFERWEGLSSHSRDKIKAYIKSGGQDNQFGNFLLL